MNNEKKRGSEDLLSLGLSIKIGKIGRDSFG
jgi:hypothetical protein